MRFRGLFSADSETLRIFGCVREFALTDSIQHHFLSTSPFSQRHYFEDVFVSLNDLLQCHKNIENFGDCQPCTLFEMAAKYRLLVYTTEVNSAFRAF